VASDAPTTLLWVRHGEADNNREKRFGGWTDLALTELGRRQAEAVASAVAALSPTAIITSDLARAAQTADAIARATQIPVAVDRDLRERSLGVFDGLTFVEAQAREPALYDRMVARDPDAVPTDGETLAAVFARVSSAIDRAVAAHPGGRVVMVSHGVALYHAFAHVCGLGQPNPAHQLFTLVDNASLSMVEHRTIDGAARWRLVAWNRIDHLNRLET
jgi:probable phosphoglycerate mutase